MSKQICICGGGALGHVIAGYLGSKVNYKVNLLTSKPEKWSNLISINDCFEKQFLGQIHCISSNPQDVVENSDVILFCLPGYAIETTLIKIKPWLNSSMIIGSVVASTGFFFIAHKVLKKETSLFGFQRTPFICRIDQYGASANLLGYKKQLCLATLNIDHPETLITEVEKMFDTPTVLAETFLEVSFTNSNPLLHPARLYALFGLNSKNTIYNSIPGFYSDWNDKSSELLIACDKEFNSILEKLPINKDKIPTILEHYNSTNASTLTQKIRSIPAFSNIKAPMKHASEGFILDINNRYFTEDFPFGILILKSVAEILGIKTPYINQILLWGQQVMDKIYLNDNGDLLKKELMGTGYISSDVFREMMQLVNSQDQSCKN
ncbi:NAD/NADP octopine/nopaline dehydrogenase family protein [Bacteroides sp. 519]|uniref:NAD/NADP octopine/nopaline dehydrogenase family protein n=1 Tax=Bacteroides sp. 519 TaxID=2302937 RepID=UPI0013D6F4BB|nr:NAD/NADP octopine/nopaline dehydrogenase family protein [Bacteroides sp. 519]NDV60033.1 NAD/NADP octopine/nopaline dehydrogenase [Bacteroides sp. 519]